MSKRGTMRICRSRTILAGLLALLVLLGCISTTNTNQQATTSMGFRVVTVKPGSAVVSNSQTDSNNITTYEYTCGATNVRITDNELFVNNLSYGIIAPQARIEIDSGVVSVDGQVVRSQLSQRERRQSPNYETTSTLYGHNVTVRPGASTYSTTNNNGKYSLTVGENTVVIEDHWLTVNGVVYGSIAGSDKIIVDEGKVTVNGWERFPVPGSAEEQAVE